MSGTGKRWAKDYDGVRVIGHVFWKIFGAQYPDEDDQDEE